MTSRNRNMYQHVYYEQGIRFDDNSFDTGIIFWPGSLASVPPSK